MCVLVCVIKRRWSLAGPLFVRILPIKVSVKGVSGVICFGHSVVLSRPADGPVERVPTGVFLHVCLERCLGATEELPVCCSKLEHNSEQSFSWVDLLLCLVQVLRSQRQPLGVYGGVHCSSLTLSFLLTSASSSPSPPAQSLIVHSHCLWTRRHSRSHYWTTSYDEAVMMSRLQNETKTNMFILLV